MGWARWLWLAGPIAVQEETARRQAVLIRITRKVGKRLTVLHSGGKSLHSWLSMKGVMKSKAEVQLRIMAGLFDTAALDRHQ